jgi:hypothetical protein
MFWNPPPAVVPVALIERLDSLAGEIGQFLTGIFPALVGAQARDVRVRVAGGADGTHRARVQVGVPRLLPWLPVPAVAASARVGP